MNGLHRKRGLIHPMRRLVQSNLGRQIARKLRRPWHTLRPVPRRPITTGYRRVDQSMVWRFAQAVASKAVRATPGVARKQGTGSASVGDPGGQVLQRLRRMSAGQTATSGGERPAPVEAPARVSQADDKGLAVAQRSRSAGRAAREDTLVQRSGQQSPRRPARQPMRRTAVELPAIPQSNAVRRSTEEEVAAAPIAPVEPPDVQARPAEDDAGQVEHPPAGKSRTQTEPELAEAPTVMATEALVPTAPPEPELVEPAMVEPRRPAVSRREDERSPDRDPQPSGSEARVAPKRPASTDLPVRRQREHREETPSPAPPSAPARELGTGEKLSPTTRRESDTADITGSRPEAPATPVRREVAEPEAGRMSIAVGRAEDRLEEARPVAGGPGSGQQGMVAKPVQRDEMPETPTAIVDQPGPPAQTGEAGPPEKAAEPGDIGLAEEVTEPGEVGLAEEATEAGNGGLLEGLAQTVHPLRDRVAVPGSTGQDSAMGQVLPLASPWEAEGGPVERSRPWIARRPSIGALASSLVLRTPLRLPSVSRATGAQPPVQRFKMPLGGIRQTMPPPKATVPTIRDRDAGWSAQTELPLLGARESESLPLAGEMPVGETGFALGVSRAEHTPHQQVRRRGAEPFPNDAETGMLGEVRAVTAKAAHADLRWPSTRGDGESPVVQRSATEQAAGGSPATTAAAAVPAAQPAPEAGSAGADVDTMARQVYQILCRRLRVERERAWG